MSDVFTKRRLMIDLDEFERRLWVPCSTDQKDGELVAELLRIGGKDDPHKTDFETNTQLSAGARQDAGGLGERKQPDGQVRLAGGDFAAIEAGLLGTKQPPAAIPRDADRSTVEYERPSALAPPHRWRFRSDRSLAWRAARTSHGDGFGNRHVKCLSER